MDSVLGLPITSCTNLRKMLDLSQFLHLKNDSRRTHLFITMSLLLYNTVIPNLPKGTIEHTRFRSTKWGWGKDFGLEWLRKAS